MSDNPPTTRDRSHQPDDGFDVSQFYGGEDNLSSWATHPAAVDAFFQRQQSDFLEPLPSASGHVFSGAGVAFAGWAGVEASGNTFADFPGSFDYPPQDPTGPCPAPGPVRLETPFTSIAEPSMAVPAPSICEEEDVQTLMLKSLRSAGYGYAAIAEMMRAQLGIEITANALVKRYQKLPKVCESVSRPRELGPSEPVDGAVLT